MGKSPLTPWTKPGGALAARTLAQSYELVYHDSLLYRPVDWETGESSPLPPPGRTVWRPLTSDMIRDFGNDPGGLLFHQDAEVRSFEILLEQYATRPAAVSNALLIGTDQGLQLLDEEGKLVDPDGTFVPNALRVPLNEDPDLIDEVWNVLVEWLDGEAEAHSLLHHLATCLAPGWAAVKYVLLLGEGRNGKSVLLEMLQALFGRENVSNVTRQNMAAGETPTLALNGKLLNIVFDGQMEYIKDSGMEKTLIAGETASVRRLYRSEATPVQTNALFVEALNREPKTRDKSTALQRRLVRFEFPNTYELDPVFRARMLHPPLLGAFLHLLLDHYVRQEEVTTKLAPTEKSAGLRLVQVKRNEPVLQFLEYLYRNDPASLEPAAITKWWLDDIVASFMTWRTNEGFTEFNSEEAATLFRQAFKVRNKSRRVNGPKSNPTSRPCIVAPTTETQELIDSLYAVGVLPLAEGEDDEEALVAL